MTNFSFLHKFYFIFLLEKRFSFLFLDSIKNFTIQETDQSLKIDDSDTSALKLKVSRNAAGARNRFYFCTTGAF